MTKKPTAKPNPMVRALAEWLVDEELKSREDNPEGVPERVRLDRKAKKELIDELDQPVKAKPRKKAKKK